MKQKHDLNVQPIQASERKKLERSLTYGITTYGNIETEKRIPGGGRTDDLPDRDRYKSAIRVEAGKVLPVGKVDLGGMYNDDVYPLYHRLASLIDTVLDACGEDGTHNPHAIEELSFQWHSGRLRAEREHGTPE